MKLSYGDKMWKFDKIQQCSRYIFQNNMIIFKISSDDCDAGVKIELVDINTMEPTGNFLSYTDTVNSSIKVGDDEQCFIIKDALCGPNSISFTTPGDLFLTYCTNLLLLREEFDFCGYV